MSDPTKPTSTIREMAAGTYRHPGRNGFESVEDKNVLNNQIYGDCITLLDALFSHTAVQQKRSHANVQRLKDPKLHRHTTTNEKPITSVLEIGTMADIYGIPEDDPRYSMLHNNPLIIGFLQLDEIKPLQRKTSLDETLKNLNAAFSKLCKEPDFQKLTKDFPIDLPADELDNVPSGSIPHPFFQYSGAAGDTPEGITFHSNVYDRAAASELIGYLGRFREELLEQLRKNLNIRDQLQRPEGRTHS